MKIWLLPHVPTEEIGPAVQTTGAFPLHASLAVIFSAATVAQLGDELQANAIGCVGQPVNTGPVVSAVQE